MSTKLNRDTIIASVCIEQDTGKIIYANRVFHKTFARFLSPHENQYFSKFNVNRLYESDILCGRGMLIPISVFAVTGLFNERRLPHYGADSELSYRAKKHGFNLACSMNCKVLTKKKGEEALYQFKSNFLKNIANKRKPGNFSALVNFSFLSFPFYYAAYFILLNLSRDILSHIKRSSSL